MANYRITTLVSHFSPTSASNSNKNVLRWKKFDEAPSDSMDPIELSAMAKNLKTLMLRVFVRFEGEWSSLKAENPKRKEELENSTYLNEQLSKELAEVQ